VQPVLVNCHPEVDQQLIFGIFSLPLTADFEASRSTLEGAVGCVAFAELASLNEFIGSPAVSGVQIDLPLLNVTTGEPLTSSSKGSPSPLLTLTANVSPATPTDASPSHASSAMPASSAGAASDE
jgi:hypothetical protein